MLFNSLVMKKSLDGKVEELGVNLIQNPSALGKEDTIKKVIGLYLQLRLNGTPDQYKDLVLGKLPEEIQTYVDKSIEELKRKDYKP